MQYGAEEGVRAETSELVVSVRVEMGAEERVRKVRKMSERKSTRYKASARGARELRGRRIGCCRCTVSASCELETRRYVQNWRQG